MRPGNGKVGQAVLAFLFLALMAGAATLLLVAPQQANAAGALVLWVGMPPMAGAQLNGQMQMITGLAQSQIAARPTGATYLASSSVLGNAQGNFTAYLPDSSGAEVNIRTPDGIHLAPGGGERLSQAVLASMRSSLHIDLPG